MDFALKQCQKNGSSTGKKIAIVGAGPAGLIASNELVCLGHEIHVFDQMPEPGGLLLFGISDKRMNKENVRKSVKQLEDLGVIFHIGVNVGVQLQLMDIVKAHDAVLISTGTWMNKKLGLNGEQLKGVDYAFDYIIRYNMEKLGYKNGKSLPEFKGQVAVIGGGLTAIDACEIALEKGARKVMLIYRKNGDQAPAGHYLISKLRSNGVDYRELTQPIEFVSNNGNRLKAIKAIKTHMPDGCLDKKPQPIPIEGSEHLISVDQVLVATGLCPTLPKGSESLGVTCDRAYFSKTEGGHETKIGKVFVAGDVRHGPSYVSLAIKSGIEAAKEIHQYLMHS